MGKKASVAGEIRQPNGMPWTQSGDKQQANCDKNDNGEDLDERKPIFKLAKVADLQGIDYDKGGRDQEISIPNPER